MEEAEKKREDGTDSGVACTSGQVQNMPVKDKNKIGPPGEVRLAASSPLTMALALT